MSAGKGDTPRPLSVSRDAFAAAYERTFGKIIEEHKPALEYLARGEYAGRGCPDDPPCDECAMNSGAGRT